MARTLLFFLLCLINNMIEAQQLSPKAEVSILTIGPGASLNDAFGHSAFRVKDNKRGVDLVFNYGIYDFNTKHFYLKFAQGRLDYLIGSNYFEDFYNNYVSQNRTIKAQILNLTHAQKQALYDYLLNNMKPENRRYSYDFFYDNCATRIRDVLQKTTQNSIIFNTKTLVKGEKKSFRDLIQEHLNSSTWGACGIDTALGAVIDRPASAYEYMFLPKYIFEAFSSATFRSSPHKKVVKRTVVLFQKRNIQKTSNLLSSPLAVFGALALLILFISYRDFRQATQTRWLDAFLFTATGVVGVLLLLLWFATDHQATHQNYNMLWAFPLNLVLMPWLLKKQKPSWSIKYLKFLVVLLCLLALHWLARVQVFAISLLPLLLALLVRYLMLIRQIKKTQPIA